MGILNDTLTDALRPLPTAMVLRRSSDGDDYQPEYSDAGSDGALTVFRLQKDGGSNPPVAPIGPYHLPDTRPQAGHQALAAVIHDALLPLAGFQNGLATSESEAIRRRADSLNKFASSVPPDPMSPLSSTAISTGVHSKPGPIPAILDERTWVTSQRNDNIDDRRQETGQGALSGDLFNALPAALATPASPLSSTASDEVMAVAGPQATTPRRAGDINLNVLASTSTTAASASSASPTGPQAGRRMGGFGATPTPHPQPGTPVHAMAGTAHATSSPMADSTPRLTIGRIDVLVLAPPTAPARNLSSQSDSAFLSKHYLRRL